MDYGECAFKEILRQIERDGLTHQTELFLGVLLPKKFLERTKQIIFQEAKIKCCTAKASERCFWIFCNKKKTYFVFCDDSYFCSCISYEEDVLKTGRFPFCKHVLAACICNALKNKGETNLFSEEYINDREFATILANSMINSKISSNKK